jgi:hypothetical protein
LHKITHKKEFLEESDTSYSSGENEMEEENRNRDRNRKGKKDSQAKQVEVKTTYTTSKVEAYFVYAQTKLNGLYQS